MSFSFETFNEKCYTTWFITILFLSIELMSHHTWSLKDSLLKAYRTSLISFRSRNARFLAIWKPFNHQPKLFNLLCWVSRIKVYNCNLREQESSILKIHTKFFIDLHSTFLNWNVYCNVSWIGLFSNWEFAL